VTPGNPLWFLDLVSLLSQPAPPPTPPPVRVNLIPVREWRRDWTVYRLLRQPFRRRRRRLISKIGRYTLSISDKQYMFLGAVTLLMAAVDHRGASFLYSPTAFSARPIHFCTFPAFFSAFPDTSKSGSFVAFPTSSLIFPFTSWSLPSVRSCVLGFIMFSSPPLMSFDCILCLSPGRSRHWPLRYFFSFNSHWHLYQFLK
jgi:hypothetical protein